MTADHQTKNAQSLVDAGAALMIKDEMLTGSALVEAVDEIMQNQTKRQQMATASKSEGIPDASQRLYQLVKEITV